MGNVVQVTDASTPGPSGPITAWDWDWGDETAHANVQNPGPHTYTANGTYDITLTVTGTSPDGTDVKIIPVLVELPPSPPGTTLFDGRAKNMSDIHFIEVAPNTPGSTRYTWHDGTYHWYSYGQTYLPGYGVTHWDETLNPPNYCDNPSAWDGLTFIKNNISLQNDARYGKIFKCTAAVGDSNVWLMPSFTDKGAAQISMRKWYVPEHVDYYAFATKVDTWPGSAPQWDDFLSLGYQTAANDQLGFMLRYHDTTGQLGYACTGNCGYGNNPIQNPVGTSFWRNWFMAVTLGRWEEWVIGVRWSTYTTGWVEIWHRTPSLSGTWTSVWSRTNTATQMYGTTPTGTWSQDGTWTHIDKLGIYYGVFASGTSHTQYIDGLVRCSSLAAAQAIFPAV